MRRYRGADLLSIPQPHVPSIARNACSLGHAGLTPAATTVAGAMTLARIG